MTSFQILLISFLTILTSSAKSFKESTVDNENSSQDTEITPYGLVNDRESITLYLKNDDIMSISEFNKFYNPEQHHQTNFRFIKERDSDYVNKLETEDNKTTSENPELKEYKEESKGDRNFDAATVDSKEESSESKSERSSTETIEIESTTTSIISQGKTIKSTEGYENDLESPEHFETTESYFKNSVSNDDNNSDTIQLRRSVFPNEKLLLDNKGEISNESVEISNDDQDTVLKSDIMNFEKPDQSEVESKTETPSVAPLPTFITTDQASLRELSNEDTNVERLKITPDEFKQSRETTSVAPQQMHPRPFTPQKLITDLTPLPTFKTTDQAGLREMSNEDTNFERLKIIPTEYEQSSETPSVAPQQMHPHRFIPQKQFNNPTPLPTFKITGQAGLREISNEDTNFERLKMTPDDKQRNNLDIPREISKNWKTIDDYNTNINENAYVYTPSKVKSISQQPLTNKPNFNSLYSKLTQASDHPFRNRVPVGQPFGNYRVILPNFNLQNPYLQNVSPYNFLRRTRRYSSYNNCGQNKYKIYRN